MLSIEAELLGQMTASMVKVGLGCARGDLQDLGDVSHRIARLVVQNETLCFAWGELANHLPELYLLGR
jgi:hypothetical protein